MGTAAGVVVLNSAATALAAAASDSDEDYSAFEPRWVGRERARASKTGRWWIGGRGPIWDPVTVARPLHWPLPPPVPAQLENGARKVGRLHGRSPAIKK